MKYLGGKIWPLDAQSELKGTVPIVGDDKCNGHVLLLKGAVVPIARRCEDAVGGPNIYAVPDLSRHQYCSFLYLNNSSAKQ